jgi:hypothetical protein
MLELGGDGTGRREKERRKRRRKIRGKEKIFWWNFPSFGRRHDAESEALAGIWARGIPGVGREEKMRISLAKVNF